MSPVPSLPQGLQEGLSWLKGPRQTCIARETLRALPGFAVSKDASFFRLNFTEITDILEHSAQLSNLHGCLLCLPM